MTIGVFRLPAAHYPHQIGSLQFMLDSIRALPISEQDRAGILGNNAAIQTLK